MAGVGRGIWRGLWLLSELFLIGSRFAFLYVSNWGQPSRYQRAAGLRWGCVRVLRIFVNQLTVTGPTPKSGLLVSNHLSYLDIALLGSFSPAIFVSKAEVRKWPVFGWFATLGGTLFVQRDRRAVVGDIGVQIRELIEQGHLVVLFPEGTSSGGERVLPFRSSLLESTIGQTHDLHAACVAYQLSDGVVSEDVCYWGDMTLGPHLWRLLCKSAVTARVAFVDVRNPALNRKELARQLHGCVSDLQRAIR